MKHTLAITAVLLLLVVLMVSVVTAVTDDYDLTWFTVDGGGGVSSSSTYILMGSIGQVDAGLSGYGEFSLSGGFLRQKTFSNHKIFLPAVIR